MASPATIDQQTLLEATWAAFRAQISANSQHLVLPDNLPSSVVTTIATRYSDLIDGPVSTIAVPSLSIIRFTPFAGTTPSGASSCAVSPASASESAAVPKNKNKVKVPRPPNAFILYRQAYHPIIKEQFPGIANNDISKKVGELWKGEAEDVRDAWKAKAEEVKMDHAKLHPDYSYQPRKPSEKKRRMTKRKAAALQAGVVASVDGGMGTQVPLPSFSISSEDPALMEFTVHQGPSALNIFSQMIDQHNNSQPVFTNNAPSAGVITDSFESASVNLPIEVSNYGTGFAIEHATLGGEFWGAIDGDRAMEQQRQESLSEEVIDWSAFVGEFDSTA